MYSDVSPGTRRIWLVMAACDRVSCDSSVAALNCVCYALQHLAAGADAVTEVDEVCNLRPNSVHQLLPIEQLRPLNPLA